MATRQSYSTRAHQGLKLTNVADPTSPQEVATKAYVDAADLAELATTTPTAETFGATGAVGTSTKAARADHVHAMPTNTSVALATTTPAAETAGAVGAVGTGTTAARADHVHAMPTFPGLSSTTPAQVSVTNVGAVGTGTTAARADHVHGIATVTQYDQRTATSTTNTATATDEVIFVPTGVSSIHLPDPTTLTPGKMIIVKSLGSSVVVSTPVGSIDGGLSKSVNIENWGSRSYITDGTNWMAL